jgi:starvation-inducible outer membrane lipoprotein
MKGSLIKSLGGGLALLLIAACTPYPIEKQYRKEAAGDLTVSTVQSRPYRYDGEVVIWGGSILATLNDSSGSELTILETPLDKDGYPLPETYTRGRFKAHIDAFLDPYLYQKGGRVILAGRITGIGEEPLGHLLYPYPLLEILQLRCWQNPQPNYYSPGYGSPYYYDPWYGGDAWPYFYGGFYYGGPGGYGRGHGYGAYGGRGGRGGFGGGHGGGGHGGGGHGGR